MISAAMSHTAELPALRITRVESQSMGVTLPAAPPPPGVSTALVALCALGCLAAVLLLVRGEQLLAHFIR